MRIIFRQQGEIFTVEITNFFLQRVFVLLHLDVLTFPGFCSRLLLLDIQLIEFSVSVLKKNWRYSDPKAHWVRTAYENL